MVNGTNSFEGRLEVCFNGEWGTVCDLNFGITDGTVFCRQLGYEGIIIVHGVRINKFCLIHLDATVTILSSEEHFANAMGVVWVDHVDCKGTEDSLSNCTSYSLRPGSYCNHARDVGLRCNGTKGKLTRYCIINAYT